MAGKKEIIIRGLKFISTTAQVVITLILISVEVVIIAVMFIREPPNASPRQNGNNVVLECCATPLGITAPLAWDCMLVVLCTLYAVKTRNLPENYNEAKFIGLSMYTTCVIWLAWVPIYFGSPNNILCMSVCTSLSAMVTLALLFFPKIYIILLKPECNTRENFKTTTVRCHYGSGLALGAMGSDDIIRTPGLMSEANGSDSAAHSTIQAREMMLQMANGSQLDLTRDGSCCPPWSREVCTTGVQTTDELLDPLIPRLRRRVARAVRESALDPAEGREFFSLTHVWMTSQREAANGEKRRLEARASEGAITEDCWRRTEIVREYLVIGGEESALAPHSPDTTSSLRTVKSASYLPPRGEVEESRKPGHGVLCQLPSDASTTADTVQLIRDESMTGPGMMLSPVVETSSPNEGIVEVGRKHCKKAREKVWIRHKPSLFQHIGPHTSLKWKVQKFKDKQFGKVQLYFPHTNPEATVATAANLTSGACCRSKEMSSPSPPVNLRSFKDEGASVAEASTSANQPDGNPIPLQRRCQIEEDRECLVTEADVDGDGGPYSARTPS